MCLFRVLFLILPVCLYGQTKPVPVQAPGSPAGTKQPTVTLSTEQPHAAPSAPSDKVVLTVAGETLTAGEFESIVNAMPEQFRNNARTVAGRKQFAENIVKVKLLAHEARGRKLDQTTSFKTQMAFQSDNMLAGLLYQDLVASTKITDDEVGKYYQEHKAEFERVHARHILIRAQGSLAPTRTGEKDLTDAEALAKAQEIRKKLLAGGDFAALAKTESDDTGSAQQGGDLGFFAHGQMVPPFDQAAFQLPAGQISEPVKTQFGYHIIKVEAKESKTIEQARPDIEKRLRPQVAQKFLEDLQKKSAVVLDPAYFPAQ